MCSEIFFIFILILPFICSTSWTHSCWVDHYKKFHLKWRFDDKLENITFKTEVQTLGWVGFGLSPNGGMANSDIVIGWVSDSGQSFFHDRFANSNSIPKIDESQDWKLLDAAQNGTHTILQFTRPFKTCDNLHDLEITIGTNRLIYAYGENDPKSIDNITKHDFKGTKSELLLEIKYENLFDPNDKELEYYDFTVKNITVQEKETSYWCKLFKLTPESPRHIIRISPQLTPGNEHILHHIQLNSCGHPDPKRLDKYVNEEGFDCANTPAIPKDLTYCFKPYYVYTYGAGRSLNIPKEAGFGFGTDEETTYFFIQVHYHNPNPVPNRRDSSGIRVYHTSKLRPNEAFAFITGSVINYGLMIPPKHQKITIPGHCQTTCFDKRMPKEGVKIFGVLPHSHMTGISLRARHFRGDKELPWIVDENKYDFTFQVLRFLKNHVTVLPADIITTECTYNSSLRNFTTLGGESSMQEMCLMGLLYYPRLRNVRHYCLSGITESTLLSLTGLKEINGYGWFIDPIITQPEELKNQSLTKYLHNKNDWKNGTADILRFSEHRLACYWAREPNDNEPDPLVSYPRNLVEYKPKESKCQSGNIILK